MIVADQASRTVPPNEPHGDVFRIFAAPALGVSMTSGQTRDITAGSVTIIGRGSCQLRLRQPRPAGDRRFDTCPEDKPPD